MTNPTRTYVCGCCGVESLTSRRGGSTPKWCSECRSHGNLPPRKCKTCNALLPKPCVKGKLQYCGKACRPVCSVDGCGEPRRKREWCGRHYANWARSGDPGSDRVWNLPGPCKACGSPDLMYGSRQFCSPNCRYLYLKHDGEIPEHVSCVLCGSRIDLTQRGKRGQRKKSSTKLCKPCRQGYGKYKMSARQLALRDGVDCGICGAPVDMGLTRQKDPKWCPSVDHVTPRSLGGGHEPGNLQLAHLHCNQVKSDRVTQ